MGEEDDTELVRRWQSGDAGAFGTIVRRWQGPVARFFARLLGPDAAIADLTQDVFVRAHRGVGRYREAGTFSTWLYRIALNIARDAARRAKRRPVPLPEEVPARAATVEDDWDRQELAIVVAEALAQLPDALREVLVLRHYENVNFENMSRLLGVPASTLKSRFAVALRRMRDRLIEHGYGDEGEVP